MARAYFPIFFSARRTLKQLTPEQTRNVLFAAMDYAERSTEPDGLDEKELLAFENLRIGIDSTGNTYRAASERGKRNGARGGRPRKNSGKCEKVVKTQEKEKEDEEENEKEKEEDKINDSSCRRRHNARTRAAKTTTTTEGAKALAFWSANVGHVGDYLRREVADAMAQGAAEDLVLLAMERCIEYGGGRWAYAKSILRDARRIGARDAASYRAAGKPDCREAAGGMKARSGESRKPMKNVFDRDWNAVFDDGQDP